MDFTIARRNMVACQIRPNNVTDERVLDAMGTLPRERFVPKGRQTIAYIDEDVEIAPGRFLMEPVTAGRLIDAAAIGAADNVLVIAPGTGYIAAVAGRLGGSVFALEQDSDLSRRMNTLITDMALDNVVIVEGPHAEGWPKEAPYDVILVDGCLPEVPEALTDQLEEGGRLVAVIGRPGQVGRLTLFGKRNGVVSHRILRDAMVQPAPGFEREVGFVF
ncbi:protein-L-isoaspartate O-methyltransferase [Marivibrio halodurans]|uniref:Protein-L-isoaspartate O-methyltransferase n=1 Tax=Marivibrio halodurans TaxID=2039722 RepID=A0A8J7RZ03_9PROT|nr:protein-L-isoaspartate O-methyltransferase [Marivibrio halodurans]MBP5855659.1 protein-L-isoaspartate O-methyltransferase [Marivibrio halodurans]